MFKPARLILAFIAYIGTGFSASADTVAYKQLKGDALRNAFFETTVIGEYQNLEGGIKYYRFTEIHYDDGSTDYIELGQKTVKGEWTLVGDDKICYKYAGNDVFNQTYCFFVYKSGSCYYNYGYGAMTLNGPYNWDFWTSRFVREGDGGTCAPPVS